MGLKLIGVVVVTILIVGGILWLVENITIGKAKKEKDNG